VLLIVLERDLKPRVCRYGRLSAVVELWRDSKFASWATWTGVGCLPSLIEAASPEVVPCRNSVEFRFNV
jgi:hypothetical protein